MEDAYIHFVNELMDKLWQTLPSVIEEKCLGCRNAAFDHDICSLPDRELLANFFDVVWNQMLPLYESFPNSFQAKHGFLLTSCADISAVDKLIHRIKKDIAKRMHESLN